MSQYEKLLKEKEREAAERSKKSNELNDYLRELEERDKRSNELAQREMDEQRKAQETLER